MQKIDIVLVANSPGELSALVKPVAEELARDRSKRLILVLTPCQYISGRELEFSKNLKGISVIVTADEYKKWAFLNRPPKHLAFARKGVVLFLGGDLTHAMLIARRLKYPAYAYLGERIAWTKFFRKFFVPDQAAYNKFKKKSPKEKLLVTGNLMVDSVSKLKKWEPAAKVVTFMPGSRQWEIDYMTPLYQRIIELIRVEVPDLKIQLVSSPFVRARPIRGAKLIDFEKIHNSEVVVTIPGTNTAKIAARGIPMVVVFPLDHAEVIPMEGLADLIGKVPVMGRAFKKWVAETVNRQTRHFALPNQKAGREIVSEIRGSVDPFAVALKVVVLLNNREKRRQMSKELAAAMGQPGAARKIAEELGAAL